MAVRKKGYRKITIDRQLFVWFYAEDIDNCLHIISDDKKFNVRYSIEVHRSPTVQAKLSPEPFIDVLGSCFPGLPANRHGWFRVQTPPWPDPEILTPRFVRKLILWCLTEKQNPEYYALPADYSMKAALMWERGLPLFDTGSD
jgi:hypothetical protein